MMGRIWIGEKFDNPLRGLLVSQKDEAGGVLNAAVL